MRATTTRPMMTAVAVGVAALLLLTGCSGGTSTASGTYYGARGSNGDAAVITVEGSTVTWGEFTCENVSGIDMEDSDTSVGTLDKTRTTVAWTQEGTYYKTDQFTESEDGSVITMGGGTYSKADTDAGKALLAEREEQCAERAETRKRKAAAQAENAIADAKLKPTFDKTIDELFNAAESDSLTDPWSIVAQNGITLDDFARYMDRNFDGIDALDFLAELQTNPASARGMLEGLGQ